MIVKRPVAFEFDVTIGLLFLSFIFNVKSLFVFPVRLSMPLLILAVYLETTLLTSRILFPTTNPSLSKGSNPLN